MLPAAKVKENDKFDKVLMLRGAAILYEIIITIYDMYETRSGYRASSERVRIYGVRLTRARVRSFKYRTDCVSSDTNRD